MVTRGQRVGEPALPTDRTLDLASLRLVLTPVCVHADLSHCLICKVLRAVESPLRGYNDLLGGFEELDCIVPQGRLRNGGFSREKIRGVSIPPCSLRSITFLSQPLISPVTTQQ